MARQMNKTTIETIETTGFALKQIIVKKLSLLSLLSLKKESCKDMFFFRNEGVC